MSKIGMRADKVSVRKYYDTNYSEDIIVKHGVREIISERNVEYFTMTCDLCDGIGRHDERSEVVCEDCGRVISQNPDGRNEIAIYADKYCQSQDDPDSGHGNRGGSGHPLMRVPALADPGPSGDDCLGGSP